MRRRRRAVICVRESHGGGEVVNELVSFPATDGEPRRRPHGSRLLRRAARRPRRPARLPRLGPSAAAVPRLRALGRRGARRRRRRRGDLPAGVGAGRRALLGVGPATAGGTSTATASAHRTRGRARLPRMWIFGLRTYGFLDDGRIACTLIDAALHSFAVLEPQTGELERLDLPFTASMPYVTAHGTRFAIVAGAPTEPVGIHIVDSQTGAYETVARQNVSADRAGVDLRGPRDRVRFARANRARLLLSADECGLRRAGGREAAAPRGDPRRADVAGEARLRTSSSSSTPRAAGRSSTSTTAARPASAARIASS